ncbi:MAG TPA: ABC transporter permease [Candidatus Limnocylindria bacterium]|nr:ABC transporter permease [Candidatus Limnocylindria bacterium]
MKYALKRLLQLIPLLLILTFVVFLLVRVIPGDPVELMLGMGAPENAKAAERARLGLDKPFLVQYFTFLGNVLRGDLGKSLSTGNKVAYEIVRRFPNTLLLAFGGTLVAAVFGIVLGVWAAVRQNRFSDNAIMVVSLLSVSTPSFFLALLLMLWFSLYLGWLPSIGMRSWQHAVLPIVTLGTQAMGLVARTTRSSMLDVLGQDYIRTSRSRGIPENTINYVHALKNALIPVVTVLGLRFGGLLAGAPLVETVFTIPGQGRLMVDGVLKRDYPVVQGTILVFAVSFVVVNTAVDLLYSLIDPRVKYE